MISEVKCLSLRMARRTKKAVVWVSKEFELLAFASVLPPYLGKVVSLIA